MFYAAIPNDGPQLGNPRTAKVFNENFFRDFRAMLGKEHVIQKFSKCDFEVRGCESSPKVAYTRDRQQA